MGQWEKVVAALLATVLIAINAVVSSPAPLAVHAKGYRIELRINLEQATYKGRVKIDIINRESEPVNQLQLKLADAVKLKEDDIKIIRLANDDLSDEESEEDVGPIAVSSVTKKDNRVVLDCSTTLQKDSSYQIDLHFEGLLSSDSSHVFFRDSYVDSTSGETRWFVVFSASTQSAYNIFPIMDQHHDKAWVELTVVHKQGYSTISNTPIMEQANESERGTMKTLFSRTPIMSINSLGVFISDFKMPQVEILQTDGVKVGVWGREDITSVLGKAQQILPSVMVSLELYFSRPYPLQHLNFVALPGYQGDKPIDSWGLQWFKESDLMNTNSYWLTHRLAKSSAMQWLGHLATPSNDTLVTNGLAGFIASIVAKQLEPSIYSWHLNNFHTAVLELGKSRNFGISKTQMDFLMETKVSLLMQMIEDVLGSSTFKQAIQNFLAKKEFKTYTEADLWQVITEQAWVDKKLQTTITLGEITKQWMKKRLPLVTVSVDVKKNLTSFTQEEFIDNLDSTSGKIVKKGGVDHNTGWWIPLVVREGDTGVVRPMGWLAPEQHSVALSNISTASYVILNPGSKGPYIINYDAEGWDRVTAAYAAQSPEVRAQLIHDSITLALSGHLSSVTALQLSGSLKMEESPDVWRAFFPLAERLRKRFQGTSAEGTLDEYVKALLQPVWQALGDEDSKPGWKAELRAKTKHLLCEAGHPPCVESARDAFAAWMNASNPEEGSPVSNSNMCPVMAYGTMEEWEFALQRIINFPKNRTKSERAFLLKALAGCPREQKKYEMLINATFLDEAHSQTFSDEDKFLILASISGETVGYTTLFEMLRSRWSEFKMRLQSNLWEFFIQTAMGSFRTSDWLKQVKEVAEQRKSEMGSATKACEESIARVESRVKWSRENTPAVEAWLNQTMAFPWIQHKFKFQDVYVSSPLPVPK